MKPKPHSKGQWANNQPEPHGQSAMQPEPWLLRQDSCTQKWVYSELATQPNQNPSPMTLLSTVDSIGPGKSTHLHAPWLSSLSLCAWYLQTLKGHGGPGASTVWGDCIHWRSWPFLREESDGGDPRECVGHYALMWNLENLEESQNFDNNSAWLIVFNIIMNIYIHTGLPIVISKGA